MPIKQLKHVLQRETTAELVEVDNRLMGITIEPGSLVSLAQNVSDDGVLSRTQRDLPQPEGPIRIMMRGRSRNGAGTRDIRIFT